MLRGFVAGWVVDPLVYHTFPITCHVVGTPMSVTAMHKQGYGLWLLGLGQLQLLVLPLHFSHAFAR